MLYPIRAFAKVQNKWIQFKCWETLVLNGSSKCLCFVPTLGGSYELFTIFSFYSVEEVSKQTWRRKNSADVMKIAV